jgi:hypothetical protein
MTTVSFTNQDIIFIDPCYFVKDNEVWEEYCEDFSENKSLDKLGISNGILMAISDVYKDILVNTDTGDVIGEICSDSYLLGCFQLDEVLKHNPDFESELETCPLTIIRNFTGTVTFSKAKEMVDGHKYTIVTVKGKGSVNFRSEFSEDEDSKKT